MNKTNIQNISINFFNKAVVFNNNTDFNDNVLWKLKLFSWKNFIVENFEKIPEDELKLIIEMVEKNIVSDKEKKNTFYKTWNEVIEKEASGERYIDQIIHYITTYGNKYISDEIKQYIPNDEFIRDNEEKVRIIINDLKVIQIMSFDDFFSSFKNLIKSNIALKSNDVELIAEVIKDLDQDETVNFNVNISEITNKELKNKLILEFWYTPDKAIDLIRVITQIVTDSTLYIKNRRTIEAFDGLKYSFNSDKVKKIEELFLNFSNRKNGLIELAKIFYREKVIFLAIKRNIEDKEIKRIINKVRKLADKYKEVIKGDEYKFITTNKISTTEKVIILEWLDTSYLIKIYNALLYRINIVKELDLKEKEVNSETEVPFIYLIRNGRSYVTRKKLGLNLDELYLLEAITKKQIEKRIQARINELYLPQVNNGISYALPTSLKQFLGNIPYGSNVKNKWNIVVWVTWHDLDDGTSVDLDLSSTNTAGKIGWNTHWASNSWNAIYSGDMRSAPYWATELFLYKDFSDTDIYNVKVTDYNNITNIKKIPFKMFVSKANGVNRFYENPKIDDHDIIFQTGLELEEKTISLGLVIKDEFLVGSFTTIDWNVADIDSKDLIIAYKTLLRSKLKLDDLDLKFYTKEKLEEKREKNKTILEWFNLIMKEDFDNKTINNLFDTTKIDEENKKIEKALETIKDNEYSKSDFINLVV